MADGMDIRTIVVSLFTTGLLLACFTTCMGAEPEQDDDAIPIVIIPESESIEIGEEIILSGQIDPMLISNSPSSVVILITAPEGSRAETFVLETPDSDGRFKSVHVADVGGEWGFESLYNGFYSDKIEVSAHPSATPTRTSLTLSGWPTYPKVGESVSFRGRLTDATGKGIPYRELIYEVSVVPGGCLRGCGLEEMKEWEPFGEVGTDKKGEFVFSLPVAVQGGVGIRMTFEGDDQYSPAHSKNLYIKATSA